jgi:hypothetical protein
MIERWANTAFTTIFLVIFFLAMWIVYGHSAGLVSIFESRFGAPGTPHVVPECSCTFKYVGTRVDGADYFVHFKKLD